MCIYIYIYLSYAHMRNIFHFWICAKDMYMLDKFVSNFEHTVHGQLHANHMETAVRITSLLIICPEMVFGLPTC